MERTLENEWLRYKTEESALAKSSPGPSRKSEAEDLAKAKLGKLDYIIARYMNDTNTNSLAANLFKVERNSLEKIAYPAWLDRLFYRGLSYFAQRKTVNKINLQSASNRDQIADLLKRTGLGWASEPILKKMEQGLGGFIHPVSFNISDKERMDLSLTFTHSEKGYHLESIKMSSSSSNRQHTFKIDEHNPINITKAYSLLSGRAVQYGTNKSEWIQFDFSSGKDPQGNFFVKRFTEDFGFNLEKSLERTGVRDMVSFDQYLKILDTLRNGDEFKSLINHQGVEKKIALLAEPGKKECNLRVTDLNAPKKTPVKRLKVRHTPALTERKRGQRRAV